MDVRIPNQLLEILKSKKLDTYPQKFLLFGNTGKPAAKPCGTNYFGNKHLEILRTLNFTEEYALYSWKHTGVVSAVLSGINIKELQLQLRHYSLDEVQQYLKDLGIMDSTALKSKFPDF